MSKPKNPNPMPGYCRAKRCPDCGAFADVNFRRVGHYHVTCMNCGLDDVVGEETMR